MPDRRTFLKMNLALPVALSLGPGFAEAAGLAESQADFLFLEAAESIPVEGVGPTTEIVRFEADPLELWTHYCLPEIERGLPVFAGVTTGYTAFSLAEIARDYGYTIAETTTRSDVGSLELNGPGYLQWELRSTGPNFRGS